MSERTCPKCWGPVDDIGHHAAPFPALTREALTQLRKHDLEDGPCWCDVEPNRANGWSHVARCRQAKAAIGDDGHEALRSVLDVLIEWTPRLCEGKAKVGDVADALLTALGTPPPAPTSTREETE